MAEHFVKEIDDLVIALDAKKQSLKRFICKNFVENRNYITKTILNNTHKRGGHNKICMYLSDETYELVKNTYNLKHRYIKQINKDCEYKNIVMSIENQTIGFLENSFKNIYQMKRQQKIGTYFLDLYFIDYKLAIECDEYGHADYNKSNEKERENYILNQGISIIRYNPNNVNFDLSCVINSILNFIMNKINVPNIIVT